MRNQPATKHEGAEKQELQRRIAFANRPRLNVTQKRLDEVSSALAKSSNDRKRFVQDPTAYLQSQSLPVSSCDFVQPSNGVAQTSEVCTMMILLNCFVTMEVQMRQQVSIWCVIDCGTFVVARVIGYETQEFGMASNFDHSQQGTQVL